MRPSFLLLVLALLLASPALAAPPSFIAFESGPVRPLALSPDGTRLYAVNTPDARLEIFAVGAGGLTHLSSVPVGMEPVAVAVRPNGEVWVVNHLSDSVSIVDPTAEEVTKTLLVGDEPRDIVFAGTGAGRAFITTAHRGQHRTDSSIAAVPGAGDPQLTTEGIGRADVWVFDAATPGDTLGGTPLEILTLFGDTPRALTVSPDGNTVYAAIFHSGNQTTMLHEAFLCEGFDPFTTCPLPQLPAITLPGGNPGPATNHAGEPAPEVGLIVKKDPVSGLWEDELDRDFSFFVRFDLPDQDVFEINANSLAAGASHTGVGTILMNMATNPVSGKVYVSNTDARNEVRFEGPGVFGGSTVQGHLHEARITVIDGASVLPRHLNKHLNYSLLAGDPGFDPTDKNHSLATPTEMAVSSDGATLYVAAFGSSKIGVIPTATLENDTFDPTTLSSGYIDVSGGGPSGIVVDDVNGRLYVATRFDNGVSVIDPGTSSEIAHHTFYNPEPVEVVEGRPFLYDAVESSANGEASCSSCHVFGDLDSLGWDLGNPDDDVKTSPLTIVNPGNEPPDINGTGNIDDFHPMKGPMTTQTLRGMVNHGSLHWRGDRSNGFFGVSALDSELSFKNFIVAFSGLLGRDGNLSETDMQKFTDFALAMTLPPNPIRDLDNQLTTSQQNGRDFFVNTVVDGPRTCEECHTLDAAQGFFGGDGSASFEGNPQIFKIPHLRNMYTKVGMFGFLANFGGGAANTGDQVRGFGFNHAGAIDTAFRFVSAAAFNFPDEPSRRDMEAFMHAFDNDIAPVVGQQVTLTAANAANTGPRIDLLIQRASAAFASKILDGTATECDLIAKINEPGAAHGYRYSTITALFQPDDGTAAITDAALRDKATIGENPVTYTCVPPGSGKRMGIDRDEDALGDGVETGTGVFVSPTDTGTDAADPDTDDDGFADGVEVAAGTDPNSAASFPASSLPALPPAGLALLALALAGAGYAAGGRVTACRRWSSRRATSATARRR
jgi:YVTN family beta-propeller protein